MTRSKGFLLSVSMIVLPTVAFADGECQKCVSNALAGAPQNVGLATVVGALGGLAVGSAPGAVCGAILGAVGSSLSTLVDVSECAPICTAEAAQRSDPSGAKCDDALKGQ